MCCHYARGRWLEYACLVSGLCLWRWAFNDCLRLGAPLLNRGADTSLPGLFVIPGETAVSACHTPQYTESWWYGGRVCVSSGFLEVFFVSQVGLDIGCQVGERVLTLVQLGRQACRQHGGGKKRAQTEVCGRTGLGAVSSCCQWLVLRLPLGATAPSMPQEDSGRPSAPSGGTLVGALHHYDAWTHASLPALNCASPGFQGLGSDAGASTLPAAVPREPLGPAPCTLSTAHERAPSPACLPE